MIGYTAVFKYILLNRFYIDFKVLKNTYAYRCTHNHSNSVLLSILYFCKEDKSHLQMKHKTSVSIWARNVNVTYIR